MLLCSAAAAKAAATRAAWGRISDQINGDNQPLNVTEYDTHRPLTPRGKSLFPLRLELPALYTQQLARPHMLEDSDRNGT